MEVKGCITIIAAMGNPDIVNAWRAHYHHHKFSCDEHKHAGEKLEREIELFIRCN